MERLDDEGQWIILMGFIISVGIFFLAIIINQSVMVGQTTSEGVLEFPKNEIQDVRDEIIGIVKSGDTPTKEAAISGLAINREDAVVWYIVTPDKFGDSYYNYTEILIHYNNGVTLYEETYLLAEKN